MIARLHGELTVRALCPRLRPTSREADAHKLSPNGCLQAVSSRASFQETKRPLAGSVYMGTNGQNERLIGIKNKCFILTDHLEDSDPLLSVRRGMLF